MYQHGRVCKRINSACQLQRNGGRDAVYSLAQTQRRRVNIAVNIGYFYLIIIDVIGLKIPVSTLLQAQRSRSQTLGLSGHIFIAHYMNRRDTVGDGFVYGPTNLKTAVGHFEYLGDARKNEQGIGYAPAGNNGGRRPGFSKTSMPAHPELILRHYLADAVFVNDFVLKGFGQIIRFQIHKGLFIHRLEGSAHVFRILDGIVCIK